MNVIACFIDKTREAVNQIEHLEFDDNNDEGK